VTIKVYHEKYGLLVCKVVYFLKTLMFWTNLPSSYSGLKSKPSMKPAEPGGKQGCTALQPKSQDTS
jgi:hypothetical protein